MTAKIYAGLPSPRRLRVNSALDLGAAAPLGVMTRKQILTDQRQLEIFIDVPAEPQIQVDVALDLLTWKTIHIAKDAIQVEVSGQIDESGQGDLILRA